MFKMKVCFFCLALFLYNPSVGFTQLRIGIKAEGALSSVVYSSQELIDQAQVSHTDIQKQIITYSGGFVFELKAGKRFILRPGIDYYKKGWRVDAADRGRINSTRFLREYMIHYVQLPVNILLTTPLANGKVYIGTGPYVAYAFNGIVKTDGKTYDLEFKKVDEPVFTYLPNNSYQPIQFISHYTVNRIDYGMKGLLGYEFNSGVFLETGIDVGIRQVTSSFERYDPQRNRTIRDPSSGVKYSIFHVGAGWMFN